MGGPDAEPLPLAQRTLLFRCELDAVETPGRDPAKHGQTGAFAPTRFLAATGQSHASHAKCLGGASADRNEQV